MKDENVKILETKYPVIFQRGYGGMGIGDGWFKLINRMCGIIQNHLENNKDHIKYGHTTEKINDVICTQIKEKFGALRFYYSGGDDFVRGVTTMTEAMSGIICESCGSPGKIKGEGWVKCRCEKCK